MLTARPEAAPWQRCTNGATGGELLVLVKDRAWLVKVTNAVNQHWHKQNARKKKSLADGLPNRHSSPVSVSMGTCG
jgi:hypothetical protein